MPETQEQAGASHILDRIVREKWREVEELRSRGGRSEVPVREPDLRGFPDALRHPSEVVVIAEVKRRSPGAGDIRPGLRPGRLAAAYQRGGAGALSVLTDRSFFGGSLDDLQEARRAVEIPVLRKDFVLDETQIVEARAAGADAILLIARILDGTRLADLVQFADELAIPVLVEAHDAEEADRALHAGARMLGVNNRDLTSFKTDLNVTLTLAERIPPDVLLVSESGIRGREDVSRLGQAGVDAVLVGEWVLRQAEPGEAVRQLAGRTKARRGDG